MIAVKLFSILFPFTQKRCFSYMRQHLGEILYSRNLYSFHILSSSKSCQILNRMRYLSLLSDKTGIQKNVAPLQAKKRISKKKGIVGSVENTQERFLVISYSSSEEYDIPAITKHLNKQGVYTSLSLPEDVENVLHVTAKYQVDKEPRHIYFFGDEGTVVFWNVPELEQRSILNFLKPYQIHSYDETLVLEEKEGLEYFYSENGTKFSRGQILLQKDQDNQLETYTFSNALALSVKLSLWEASLESFVDSIEWVTEHMRDGKKVAMSRDQVFRKRGELFALRHVINLSSDLLDTPDFYWDRQHLEVLYQQTYNHLNISKRTKVMNERLSYCSELIDLLSNHMNDKHHVRLELMIIALIMVEVMFECIHFLGRIL